MIGQTIEGYEVLDELGAGGMGVVYKARHTRLQRLVALKILSPRGEQGGEILSPRGEQGGEILSPRGEQGGEILPPEHLADERRGRRFLQEARAASALNHPGIVTIHDIVTHDGVDVIVMELIEGESLAQRIPSGGLPWREAADFALELSEAMAAAHDAGIVHRDLKPANVMVATDRSRIKVLDFGIAKLMPDPDRSGTLSQASEHGARFGTPAYMAPEQLLGEPVDPRTDIFAFGVLVYEMLTGQRPFRSHSPAVLVDEIVNADPPGVRELRPDLHAAFAVLVDKALAKQPAKRHQSMDEIGAELRALLDSGSKNDLDEIAEGVTLKTLVACELESSTLLAGETGGEDGEDIEPEDLARGLVEKYRGREARIPGGHLLLFELPWDAVRFALAFHQSAAEQGHRTGTEFETRVGIHLGEVTARRDGDRDPWTFDVDAPACATTGRVLSLATPGQTLLTHAAFDLARRGAARRDREAEDRVSPPDSPRGDLAWLAHGDYVFAGGEVIEVFEVGTTGFAPLTPPAASGEATRTPARGKILGWRPAPGLTVPQRPNWVVEQKLGEGGFGDVWLAAHAKTHEHRVFKFCYEAERLRSLQREITVFRLLKEELGDRDDIARLIDWNLDEAPYFIESAYTEGGSLVEWCAAQGGLAEVELGERLELVAQIATALEAAHSVGVLHKDVKPANVLITLDAEGRPRAVLSDFGIGRITERERLEVRGITVLGLTEETSSDSSSLSGTRLYMAPELLTGRGPTIQSDIYALGVLLYQAVIGDFDRPLAPGWERDVGDELLSEDIADFADGRPRHRPRNALEVAERLRALEERRAAREAERRARQEAVEAERRARQEAREAARRRRLYTAGTAVAAVFVLVVTVLALQAVRARADAERRRAQAEQLIDVLLGDLHESLDKIGRLGLLEQAARGSQAYFDSLDERGETSAVTLKRGITLLNIGDVLLKQGDTMAAHASYEAARRLFASSVAREGDSDELRDGLRRSLVKLGWVLSRQGETAAALETLHSALEVARELLARQPRDARRQAGLGECQFWICLVQSQMGNRETALATCRSALENLPASDLPGEVPWRHVLLTLDSRISVAGLLRALTRGDEALTELHQARLLAKRLADEEPGNAIWPRKLAWIRFQTGVLRLYHQREPTAALADLTAARDAYRLLSTTDPAQTRWRDSLAEILNIIGRVRLQLGEARSALETVSEAVEILEHLAAEDPSGRKRWGAIARVYQTEGRAYSEIGDAAAAVRSFAAAVEAHTRLAAVAGDDSNPQNFLSWSHVLLGDGYQRLGKQRRARREWTRALEIIAPLTARSDALRFRNTHAQVLLKLERVDEARPLVEALLAVGWDDPVFLETIHAAGLGKLVP